MGGLRVLFLQNPARLSLMAFSLISTQVHYFAVRVVKLLQSKRNLIGVHEMRHCVVCLLIAFGQTAYADLVVEWQDFSGTFPATGGAQAGTGDLDLTSSSGSITSGPSLAIAANNSQFNDANDTFLDLFFDGSSFEDFILTYDVVRTDGSGANQAPDTINWAVSLDAGALSSVGTNAVAAGANNGLTIDLTGNAAVNAATSIRLQATFSGAAGGVVSSLDFDNIQVNATAVPEPSAFIYFALLAGVVGVVRKVFSARS